MQEAPHIDILGGEEGAMGYQGQHQSYTQPNSNPPFPDEEFQPALQDQDRVPEFDQEWYPTW